MASQQDKTRFVHGQLPVSFTAPTFTTWPIPDPHGSGFYITDMDSQFAKYANDLWALELDPFAPGGRRANAWEQLLGNCLIDFDIYEQRSTVHNDYGDINKMVPTRQLRGYQIPDATSFYNTVLGFLYNRSLSKNGPMAWYNTVNATFYSLVDPSIPTVEHMGAYNRFFVALNGSARYSKNIVTVSQTGSRLPFLGELIEQAWLHVWGETITYASNPANWAATIWLPAYKNRNLYRLPATGKGLSISGDPTSGFDGNRMAYDPSTLSFVSKNNAVEWFFENMQICHMPMARPTAATDYQWLGDPHPGDAYGPVSMVAFIGVRNGTQKAILVKPFAGADVFTVPKFDTDQYQLEAFYTQPGKTKRWIVLDATQYISEGGGHNFSPIRIPKSALTDVMSCSTGKRGVQPFLMGDLFFYLRRKGTQFVGPIWSPYIHSEFAKRANVGAASLYVGYR